MNKALSKDHVTLCSNFLAVMHDELIVENLKPPRVESDSLCDQIFEHRT